LKKDNPSLREISPGRRVFCFPLFPEGLRPIHIFPDPFSTSPVLSVAGFFSGRPGFRGVFLAGLDNTYLYFYNSPDDEMEAAR
jgi:hypothetical protein